MGRGDRDEKDVKIGRGKRGMGRRKGWKGGWVGGEGERELLMGRVLGGMGWMGWMTMAVAMAMAMAMGDRVG